MLQNTLEPPQAASAPESCQRIGSWETQARNSSRRLLGIVRCPYGEFNLTASSRRPNAVTRMFIALQRPSTASAGARKKVQAGMVPRHAPVRPAKLAQRWAARNSTSRHRWLRCMVAPAPAPKRPESPPNRGNEICKRRNSVFNSAAHANPERAQKHNPFTLWYKGACRSTGSVRQSGAGRQQQGVSA